MEKRNIIFTSVITSFITTFMGSALNLSIPDLETEFNADAKTVGWVVTIYMLTCASLAVPFGRIADKINRKKILALGTLIFSVSSAFAAISWKMWVLLAFRLLQGVGASMIFCTNIAILVGAFDDSHRGRVLGYSTCANYAGLSAGPVLGGILNYNFGWRSLFISTAVISVVALYWIICKLPKGEYQENSIRNVSDGINNRDIEGNISFVVSIVMMMYGLSTLKSVNIAPFILGAGIIVFIVFIRIELKTENPVVNVRMFKDNLPYCLSNFAALLNYGSTFSVSYLLSIYLQVIKDYTSQRAGLLLITSTVVMAVISPIAGRISDKFSPYMLSSVGMALCAGSLGLLAFLPSDAGTIQIIVILFISGAGSALFSSPNTNAVMASVGRKDYSVASSILSTMRSVGHTASMAVVTAVVSLKLGDSSLSDAEPGILMETIHTAFLIFALLCVIGIFMALKRKT